MENIVKVMEQVVERYKVNADSITWSDQMQPYFEDLAKTARVGYALYVMIDGEKVYLARTELQKDSEGAEK